MKYGEREIEQVADYYFNIYNGVMDYNYLTIVAKRMLVSGPTLEEILSGDYDTDIYMYITDSNIPKERIEHEYREYQRRERQKITPEDKQKLKIMRGKTFRDVLLISLAGLGLVIAFRDISKTTNNKEDRKENRDLLAQIAGLEENSVAKHSEEVIYGTYDGGLRVSTYDSASLAQDIINGCHSDPNLFDYYLFDTFHEISKSRNTVAPLALFDDVLDELVSKMQDDGELVEVYNRINGCPTFLDYLYRRGFVPPTDADYYDLGNDIARYYVLRLAGERSPIDRLPKESQRRIAKILKAFLSQDYEDVLKGEFADDLARLVSEGGRNNG